MYSVKIFPGEGRSLKEYPTKHYPKKKTPHKGGPALLQLIQTGGPNRLSPKLPKKK